MIISQKDYFFKLDFTVEGSEKREREIYELCRSQKKYFSVK